MDNIVEIDNIWDIFVNFTILIVFVSILISAYAAFPTIL
jgi:hypothetical protein